MGPVSLCCFCLLVNPSFARARVHCRILGVTAGDGGTNIAVVEFSHSLGQSLLANVYMGIIVSYQRADGTMVDFI